jgi:uncharacterized protein
MTFRRRMRSVPLPHVRLNDRFWSHWQRVLVDEMLPGQFRQIVETGRLANFMRAAGREEGRHQGYYYNDSDVYKWLEACAYGLLHHPSGALEVQVEEVLDAVLSAQAPDGYLNSFFQLEHPHLKLRNLSAMHEMYCGGHLIEAGVAFYQCLGDRRLLDASLRFADLLLATFGPDRRPGFCGHQGIELALVKLSEVSGREAYQDLARWMIEQRGTRPSIFEQELQDEEAMAISPWMSRHLTRDGEYKGDYLQDHAPIREHTEIVGHSVRAMYFYAAATELAEGDEALEHALLKVWNNLTRRRMYVTGGTGASASNEGFTRDFDLPNLHSYAETCAACGLIFWGNRLLQMTGAAEYADVMERALYNAALAGISLDGTRYFYDNPLESRGGHDRRAWFSCACCPPNIARLIGGLGSYVLGSSDEAVYLHMPVGLEAELRIQDTEVRLRVESNYPWSGKVRVHVEPERPVEFRLKVRIPEWADEVASELPGLEQEAEFEAGYAVFEKLWGQGDVLTLDMEMPGKWIEADPMVRDNLGRVALTRGPLVYCAEERDLGFAPQLLQVDLEGPMEEATMPKLLNAVALEVEGVADVESFPDALYADAGTTETREAVARLIPYFLWNNRGANGMQVWLRRL